LLFPVTGPVRGLQFVFEQIAAEADINAPDESRAYRELQRISLQHEFGEIDDEEYAQAEAVLLGQLNAARHREGHVVTPNKRHRSAKPMALIGE